MPKATIAPNVPGRFWLATMDTRHFSFQATGATQQEAQAALVKGWEEHRVQAKKHLLAADISDMVCADIHALDDEFSIKYYEMAMGQCWRDDSVIATL